MTKSLFAAAALVALGLAGQASAAPNDDAPTQAVSTAHVDFRSEAAVRAFYRRIEAAAHDVCDSNSPNPRITQMDQACESRAVAQAIRAADRPMLTALYDTSGEAHASR